MTFEQFLQELSAKRGAAIDKAHDNTLPARNRETFAVRAEVYEEILDAAENVQSPGYRMKSVARDPEAHAQQQKEALLRLGLSEETAEARRLEILAETVRPGEPGDPNYKDGS